MIIPAYRWLVGLTVAFATIGVVFLFIIGAQTWILATQVAEEKVLREQLTHAKIMMTVQGELIADLREGCE